MKIGKANSPAAPLTDGSRDNNALDFDDEFTTLSTSPTPSEFSAVEDDEVAAQAAGDNSKREIRSRLNPHPKYFFEDGNLLIRVENVDFKIHRYFFMRDSIPFRELSENGVLGHIVDNGMDEIDAAEYVTPLVLEGLTSLDFERFLSVLYPTHFGQDEENTAAYWASVLCVSSHLSFQSIRSLSADKLSHVATPIDKIALGRRYGILHWLRDAYRAICTRQATLTKEEGRKIGVDEVIGIMEARQILLWENPTTKTKEQYKVVDRIFGLSSLPKSATVTTTTTSPNTTVVEKDLSQAEAPSEPASAPEVESAQVVQPPPQPTLQPSAQTNPPSTTPQTSTPSSTPQPPSSPAPLPASQPDTCTNAPPAPSTVPQTPPEQHVNTPNKAKGSDQSIPRVKAQTQKTSPPPPTPPSPRSNRVPVDIEKWEASFRQIPELSVTKSSTADSSPWWAAWREDDSSHRPSKAAHSTASASSTSKAPSSAAPEKKGRTWLG
ncbi:hypothetical protein AX16_010927 [Volvariella volvacea WC 439]|nr:hypothetical protein AX16_010927 [Volvariella volvacea WC 439]